MLLWNESDSLHLFVFKGQIQEFQLVERINSDLTLKKMRKLYSVAVVVTYLAHLLGCKPAIDISLYFNFAKSIAGYPTDPKVSFMLPEMNSRTTC